MDNCFEAARLAGVNRVAYASSLAVSGEQKFYGDRARHRGRFPPRPRAIRDAQDLQRMAGAGLPRKAWHGDHRDPPGQRHRPGQDRRLGRSRLLHHQPGARQAGHVPVQGRDALPGPCRRDRRDLCPRDHEGQAGAHWSTTPAARRSASARSPTSSASSCPTRRSAFDKETGGKELSGNYLIDNTPPRAGIRHPVPPLPRARAADHQRGPRRRRPSADRRPLVVRCQRMIPIRWLNRTTNDLIWWANSRNAREPSVSIGPLVAGRRPPPGVSTAQPGCR